MSPPSTRPTTLSTRVPTALPTRATPFIMCAPFTAAATASVSRNFATCQFAMCGAQSVTVNGCPSAQAPQVSCSGDTLLRLFDSGGRQLMSNDDGCGTGQFTKCSRLTWSATDKYIAQYGACQTFTVRQGCFGSGTCSGTVQILGNIMSAPTGSSPAPTTRVPTARPSTQPSSVRPTSAPVATNSPTFGFSCSACPAGTFTYLGAQACINCPALSTSVAGASSCTCQSGTTSQGSGVNLVCVPQPCPSNAVRNSLGNCMCSAGFSSIQPNPGSGAVGTASRVNGGSNPPALLSHAEALNYEHNCC